MCASGELQNILCQTPWEDNRQLKGVPLGNLGRLKYVVKVLAGTLSFDSQLSSTCHTLAVAHVIHNNNEVQKVYNKL